MDDRHRFRAPPASGIGGKPFPDVFYTFVRDPHGLWHDTCRSPWGFFSIDFFALTHSWLLLRRSILLLARFLSHTGSDFLAQRPCYGNADLIAEPAFPYSVFRRLPRTQKRAAKFLSFAARP